MILYLIHMPFLTTFLICYLIGSIPFGLILVKLAGKGDIRKIGSGNIGATNVLRTGTKKLAVLTLLLDGGKGLFGVILAGPLPPPPSSDTKAPIAPILSLESLHIIIFVAALGVLLGHIFPVWLKFKGGKGVATALGIYFALGWYSNLYIGTIACLTWLTVAVLFRYSSLAALCAIVAAFIVPTIHFFAPGWQFRDSFMPNQAFDLMVATFVIGTIVFLRHHANIRRLLNHTEPKIGKTSAAP